MNPREKFELAQQKEQLLAEVEDVLRAMPLPESIFQNTDETISWLGRAVAAIGRWSVPQSIAADAAIQRIQSIDMGGNVQGFSQLKTLLHRARHDLRMETVGPMNVVLQAGMVFDYFDAIRKVIEGARADVFFVDPYLDAEFVSRYLPHVTSGVIVRLLARERLATLLPAVEAFAKQSGATLQVRSGLGFHDRYCFVDRTSCYQSGASFKDGARSSPTTLTQVTDAFQAVWDTYDRLWTTATVER